MAESIELLSNSREVWNKLLAAKMGKRLSQTLPLSSQCCISRVPKAIYKISENAYVPQIVSIGPFHRNKESLQATEKVKWLYLNSLLGRAPTPQTNLECLIDAIRTLEKDSRERYEEEINLSSDEFVEMMLIDGCFILEMFRRVTRELAFDGDDPIFRKAHMKSRIMRDLILLENQIPMLILKCLFDLTTDREREGLSLIDLCLKALNYFKAIVPMDKKINERTNSLNPKHLLDLLRNSFIPSNLKGKYFLSNIMTSVNTADNINCATELHDAGVTFKKKDNAKSLFDINFEEEEVGVFKIPPLRVQDDTETMFRNLIAYEQCYGDYDIITSYVFLMDTLINSTKDVQLLRNKGIIINDLGSDEEVSAVINKLCKEVDMRGFLFTMLWVDVNKYDSNPWHKWRATLMRDYLNTPWKVASCIAAILLLILTTAGTLFAILSFFVHGS